MLITKELVVALIGVVLSVVNTYAGHEIFSTEQMSQLANIIFLAVTFIAAYKHPSGQTPAKQNESRSESTPSKNSDNLIP